MTVSGGRTTAEIIGFGRHLRPEVISGEATYLFSEQGVTAVQGALMEQLAPLLRDGLDLSALLRAVPDDHLAERVGQVIDRMSGRGLVTRHAPASTGAGAAPVAPRAALAYWEAAGLDPEAAVARIATGRIRLLTAGHVNTSAVRTACEEAGLAVLAVGAGPEDVDLTVVLCDDYLACGLDEIDAAQRAAGGPWLLAKPGGGQLWLGPVFRQGGGACWHCLAHRMWGCRRAEAHVQNVLGRSGPVPRPVLGLPSLTGAGAHLVAHAAAKWLAGHRDTDQQSVWTLDTLTLEGRHHELRPRPQCLSCGDPGQEAARADRPVRFRSRTKADGGGHRAMPPEQVMATYRHLVSPVTGVVKEIRRVPQGPAFLNSFVAGSNAAAGAHSLQSLRAGLRSANGGKGTTALKAEVSALCEALERHSGYFHGDERRVCGSFRSLGGPAVAPDSCQLYDPRQFAGRAGWNAAHSLFQQVPDPFDQDAVLDWTPVWSVTGDRQRLLPTAMLYYNAPQPPGPRFFRADSNGSAAGSSLEDATLQGFLELVERDAVALWWYNRTSQAGLDLESFGDPWIEDFRAVHAGLRREVWALDLTTDLGIPVVAAFSRRTDKSAEDISFGFGAHFDPRLALRRALTEVNQLLPAVVDALPDGTGYTCDDPEARHWWSYATTANQPYLTADPLVRPRCPGDYPYTPHDDLLQDIEAITELCLRHGLELLVVDQTRPDIALPVVKVVVPGLRHFWARFAPGRLFDVPVGLGRLAAPTPYDDLNPIPLFV